MERGDYEGAKLAFDEIKGSQPSYDAASDGMHLARLRDQHDTRSWSARGEICALRFLNDGRHLLYVVNRGKTIHTHSLAGDKRAARFDGMLYDPMGLSRVSTNGIMVSGSELATAHVWDVRTGHCLNIYDGHDDTVLCSDLSQDGRTAATGSADRSIHIWNTSTGELIRELKGHEDGVASVSLANDRGVLVSAGSKDCTYRIWSQRGGRHLHTISGTFRSATCVRILPDCSSFLVGASEPIIRLYSLTTYKCLQEFVGHEDGILSIEVFPGGRHFIASDSKGVVRMWQIHPARCLRTFEDVGAIVVDVAPDGSRVAFGGMTRTVNVMTATPIVDSRTYCRHRLSRPPKVSDVFLLERQYRKDLSSFTRAVEREQAQDALDCYSRLIKLEGWGRSYQIHCLFEEKHALFARQAVDTAFIMRTLSGHQTVPGAVAFSDDASLLASADDDGNVRLWEIKSGELRFQARPHRQRIGALAFTHRGDRVISGSWDGTVAMLDTATGQVLRSFDVPGDQVICLEVAPRDQSLLVGFDKKAGLWRLDRRKPERVMEDHHAFVTQVRFSPQTECGATSSNDGTIDIWDLAAGTVIRRLWHLRQRAHVQCLRWSKDGRFLFSAGVAPSVRGSIRKPGDADPASLIRVWDATSGRCLYRLRSRCSDIRSISLTPCGRFLFAGGIGGGLQVWDLERMECVEELQTKSADVFALELSRGGTLLAAALGNTEVVVYRIVWQLQPATTPFEIPKQRSLWQRLCKRL